MEEEVAEEVVVKEVTVEVAEVVDVCKVHWPSTGNAEDGQEGKKHHVEDGEAKQLMTRVSYTKVAEIWIE